MVEKSTSQPVSPSSFPRYICPYMIAQSSQSKQVNLRQGCIPLAFDPCTLIRLCQTVTWCREPGRKNAGSSFSRHSTLSADLTHQVRLLRTLVDDEDMSVKIGACIMDSNSKRAGETLAVPI